MLNLALDTGFAPAQLPGNLLIAGPRRQPLKHLDVLVTQPYLLLDLLMAHLGKLAQHPIKEFRANQPLTPIDSPNGPDQRLIGDALEQVRLGASLQRASQVLIVIIAGEHDDMRLRTIAL